MRARKQGNIITTYNQLPKTYKNHVNFRSATVEMLEQEGFYDVFTPILQTNEKLGAIYWDAQNSQFTYPIEMMTAQEIEDKANAEAQALLEVDIIDGIEASNQLKTYLKRNLTNNQYKNARILITPVWEALRNGDFDIALELMQNTSVTAPYETMKATIIAKLEEL